MPTRDMGRNGDARMGPEWAVARQRFHRGHIQNGMADLYSGHDFAEQRLDCMEKWADRIAATLSDNVVPMKQDITA